MRSDALPCGEDELVPRPVIGATHVDESGWFPDHDTRWWEA
jgi:hypothetical protein